VATAVKASLLTVNIRTNWQATRLGVISTDTHTKHANPEKRPQKIACHSHASNMTCATPWPDVMPSWRASFEAHWHRGKVSKMYYQLKLVRTKRRITCPPTTQQTDVAIQKQQRHDGLAVETNPCSRLELRSPFLGLQEVQPALKINLVMHEFRSATRPLCGESCTEIPKRR